MNWCDKCKLKRTKKKKNECRNNTSSRTEATSSSLRIPDCPQVSKSSSAWDQKFSSCSASALSGAPVKLSSKSTVWVDNSPRHHSESLSFIPRVKKNGDSFWGSGFLPPVTTKWGCSRKCRVSQRMEGGKDHGPVNWIFGRLWLLQGELHQHGTVWAYLSTDLSSAREIKLPFKRNMFSHL